MIETLIMKLRDNPKVRNKAEYAEEKKIENEKEKHSREAT